MLFFDSGWSYAETGSQPDIAMTPRALGSELMSPSPAQQRKSPNTKLQASPRGPDSSAEWWGSGWWAGGWGGWNAPVAWEGWSWNSASEGWAEEDWANESQQVRKMLQRPLTSVLEMQALDDAAVDIERELEQKIDDMNAAESKDDRFKSQDSQATLVLGQLTSSESCDDGAGHPKMRQRSCRGAAVQTCSCPRKAAVRHPSCKIIWTAFTRTATGGLRALQGRGVSQVSW